MLTANTQCMCLKYSKVGGTVSRSSPGEKARNLALPKENSIPFSRALESARKPLGFRFYLYKNLGKDRMKQSLAFLSLIGDFGEKRLCRRLK